MPAAAAKPLLRYSISDRSWSTTGPAPGYPFDGILGTLLDSGGPGRATVYGCLNAPELVVGADEEHSLAVGACPAGDTQSAAPEGWIYLAMPPNGVPATVPLYRCDPGLSDHPVPNVSTQPDCEGAVGGTAGGTTLLGYALAPTGTLNRWQLPPVGSSFYEWDTTGPVAITGAKRIIGLGYVLTAAGPNRAALFSCAGPNGDHSVGVAPADCNTDWTRAAEGWIFVSKPPGVPAAPLYSCSDATGAHTASVHPGCAGRTQVALLGYLPLAPVANPPPAPKPAADSDGDGIKDPADRCPKRARGRYDRDHDGCPGPYRRMRVQASAAWTIPAQGVQLELLAVARVPAGGLVQLKCPSCHVSERRRAPGKTGTKTVRLRRLAHRTISSGRSFSITITAAGYIGVVLRFEVRPHGTSTLERQRVSKHPFRRIVRCLPAGSRHAAKHCPSSPA